MNVPKVERGFSGLAGWVVDNNADLTLAQGASRRGTMQPSPSPSTPSSGPASPNVRTAPTPTPTTKATSKKPRSILGADIVVFGSIGLLLLLGVVSLINDQPMDSRDATSSRNERSTASAVASTPQPSRFEGVGVDGQAYAPVAGHVIAPNANVRRGAGTAFAVIGSVPQMTQVMVTGRDGSWSRVQVSVGGYQLDGYIASRLIHEGGSDGARAIVCEVMQSVRPYSGEVLLQQGRGPHHLTVNAGARDALVKLRRGGVTSLAFYVRAGESGTVQSIPDGTYQIMFATGDGFSRKCLEFVTSMQVIADPSPQTFRVTSDGYAEYYSTGTYTLTTQVGGNFRPQTVGSDTFRE